ncbi:MAG: hypothetical protein AAFQ43_12040 [Bacteroidota bacterium]
MRLFTFALILAALPASGQPSDVRASVDALSALVDTSDAAADAALRVEVARLALARADLRAATGWQRLRPRVDLYVSVSTRGLAFPSVSTEGYDPVYAALARWPGDSWGVTASWTLDQLLDRGPARRARAGVAIAEARVDLHDARRRQREAHSRERELAQARRQAERQERTQAARALLAADAPFLRQRLAAQRELLRLAELSYEQGDVGYTHLARQRLAVLDARRAVALNAARRAALDAGLPSDHPVLSLAPRVEPDGFAAD